MTIHKLWTDAVARHGDLPFVGWVDSPALTFAETDKRVRSLRAYLEDLGLRPGDKVALWAPNHPSWGLAYLAVTTGPLTVMPLLPEFSPTDTANALVHGGARVLIVGRALVESWQKGVATLAAETRAALADLRLEVLEDLVDGPAAQGEGREPQALPSPADLAALIYTSGTTGTPKGVMLTHANLVSNVLSAAPLPGLVAGDKMLSVLPLAHTYECTLGFLLPIHIGVHISYLPKPPSPAVLLPALESVRPHALLTVPLFMEKIYRSKVKPGLRHGVVGVLHKVPGLDLLLEKVAGAKLMKTFGGRMKFFGVGGAALAPEVARFLHRAGFPYAIGYGLTETSPLVAGHLKVHLYSTGKVLDGVTVKIAEPRNEAGAGEILVKGPNVMAGYYKDPVRTAEVMTPDGWFRTGDLGLFDDDGHLFIKGRSKNLILGPSGENIYPEAIEALINQDRLVSESLVLQRGQEIVAKVVLNYELFQEQVKDWGGDASAAVDHYLKELQRQINQQLARFSRVSTLEVQELPFEKTATLKIKRYLYG